VKVQLSVTEPCNAVTFHAKELEILAGVLVDASGVERTNPGGPDVLYGDTEQETATVALAQPLTQADVGTTVTLTLIPWRAQRQARRLLPKCLQKRR
jgi:hypothetical protein